MGTIPTPASPNPGFNTIRPTLAARFPGGIPAFSLGCLPRANLHRAKFLRTLAAHPSEGRSPLPFFFHAEGIHDSWGRDGFPWRPLASRVASSARAGLLVATPSPPRHPVESSTPPRQSVTAATPPSHRFGHANGETASSYISVPPARVSDFLIRSSHRLSH